MIWITLLTCLWVQRAIIEHFNSYRSTHDFTYLTERMKSPGLFWLGQTMKLPFWPSFRSSSSACRPVAYAWNHLHGNDPKNDRHQQKGHDQGNPPSRILTFRWPSRSCKVKLFSLCTLMKSTILSGVADCFLIAAFARILLYVCMWWLRAPNQDN